MHKYRYHITDSIGISISNHTDNKTFYYTSLEALIDNEWNEIDLDIRNETLKTAEIINIEGLHTAEIYFKPYAIKKHSVVFFKGVGKFRFKVSYGNSIGKLKRSIVSKKFILNL